MTEQSQAALAAHQEQSRKLAASIEALGPAQREFVAKWRRAIELLGRADRSCPWMAEFVADVKALVPVPEKVAGMVTKGSGA